MKNQKVLITGGAGFIGSNLAEELALENEVVVLDDLSTGKGENIKKLTGKDNFKFIRGSITDLELLQKISEGIDYVFHLAAKPSVPERIKDPISSNEVNINGTLNLLIAARDHDVRKVVYSSSCAVYGDANAMPVSEMAAVCPKSPYAVAKLTGEYYGRVFTEIYDIPVASLRYFNVYGPRQDPNSEYAAVVPKFISKVMGDTPPVIYGDGLQTRDFVFVRDVVRANILASKTGVTGEFNIGGGNGITILELADKINDLWGKDIKPFHEGQREGEIKHSWADISKARSFGYEPAYSLKDGLRETIRWYSNETI